MSFIPVPNVVEVRFVHSYIGHTLTNSLYFEHNTVPNPQHLIDLASAAASIWSSQVVLNLSGELRLREVYCRDLSSAQSYVYSYTGSPLPSTGVVYGDPLSAHVAIVISLRTGLAGRSCRGRLFIGGLSEQQVWGDSIISSTVQAIRNGVAAVIDQLNTTDRRAVVVSRYTAGQPRTVGVCYPILSVLASTTRVATQRKRLPGV